MLPPADSQARGLAVQSAFVLCLVTLSCLRCILACCVSDASCFVSDASLLWFPGSGEVPPLPGK